MHCNLSLKLFSAIIIIVSNAFAQQKPPASQVAGIPVNYDEALTGDYILPNVLTLNNRKQVKSIKTWQKQRRPEILKFYEENQFGKMPPRPTALSFNVFDKGTPVFEGKAIRKQITIYFTKDTSRHKTELLIYLPANKNTPAPLLLVANFSQNSNATNDPGVKPSLTWTKEGKRVPATTGRAFGKLDVEKFVLAGFGIATLCYTDIEPDALDGILHGIRREYLKNGSTQPAPDEWGAISAWAWEISRAIDYFETDKDIDAKRIAIQGTSRLGKTVLWAGASDPRIAMVIASCSGEGGAAISRRNYGETIKHLTAPTRYPYQFAANYHNFASDYNSYKVDGHMLVSLMAPRPVLLQTGDTDVWSDPKGEFIAAAAAEPVYKLFGKSGPGNDIMPKPGDRSMLNPLGYFMHAGGHGTIPSDWDVYLEFMKKYL